MFSITRSKFFLSSMITVISPSKIPSILLMLIDCIFTLRLLDRICVTSFTKPTRSIPFTFSSATELLFVLSTHFAFKILYAKLDCSLIALGQSCLWIFIPSRMVVKPNTSSPGIGEQHFEYEKFNFSSVGPNTKESYLKSSFCSNGLFDFR